MEEGDFLSCGTKLFEHLWSAVGALRVDTYVNSRHSKTRKVAKVKRYETEMQFGVSDTVVIIFLGAQIQWVFGSMSGIYCGFSFLC